MLSVMPSSRQSGLLQQNMEHDGTPRNGGAPPERGGTVHSQHAAITLQLHRHVRLIASVEEEEVESDKGKSPDLGLVGYWLKGRLMQTVLEVCLKLLYCYGC